MEDALRNALALSERVHAFVTKMLGTSARNAKGIVVNEFYFVPMTLLARALRHHKAIACLAKEGYATEAAIVALTQFELCLDVLYIGQDRTHATEWVEHSSEVRQPWSVQEKINSVYSGDAGMREANHGVFRNLSQIKHLNPLAGPYGFTMRVAGPKTFTIATNPDQDDLSHGWSVIIVGFCCHKILEAAAAVKRCHSDFVQLDEGFDRDIDAFITECRSQMGRAVPTSDFPEAGTVH